MSLAITLCPGLLGRRLEVVVTIVDLAVDTIVIVLIFCNLMNVTVAKVAYEPWAIAQVMGGGCPQIWSQ